MQRFASYGLLLLAVICALLTAYMFNDYHDRREALNDAALDAARSQAIAAAQNISTAFGEFSDVAETLAADLTAGTVPYTDIEARLLADVRARPDIDGLSITFAPYAYEPDLRLFQTYLYRTAEGEFDVLRGATYDYTLPPFAVDGIDTAWYVDTVAEGAQWHEPFFAAGAQKILVEYGVPFYPVDASDTDPEPAGIVAIDTTLEDVRDLMAGLELGATGYGFVISDQGTFLAHPVPEFVVNRTIFDLFSEGDAVTRAARNAIGDGRQDFLEADDPITGDTTWHFFEPIGSTGWTIGIVLYQEQFQAAPHQTARDQMIIALALAGAVFFAATTVFHVDRLRFTNFWAVSATFSVLCVMLIAFAWMLTNRLHTRNGVSITSQAQLDRYLESIDWPVGTQLDGRVKIPTGILVEALDFPDPTSVTMNGYIWQRYPENADVARGFALPDRIGEEATLEEVRREAFDGEELIVWYVGVTLRQTYDTTRFPFDHRTINVRLAPRDLGAHVVLTPDLQAYDWVNPRLLPGVSSQVDINNWILQNSRFSYVLERSNTSLGMPGNDTRGILPALQFSIQTQRVLLGPFIAYLLPGLIAAAMTFAYLLTRHEPGQNHESINALNFAAALFFVVAVIHTALRDRIAAIGITYLELVYILLYLDIIAVAANLFALARFPDWAIIRYRDNLIPKVLYWPVFAGVMLVSTLIIFVF